VDEYILTQDRGRAHRPTYFLSFITFPRQEFNGPGCSGHRVFSASARTSMTVSSSFYIPVTAAVSAAAAAFTVWSLHRNASHTSSVQSNKQGAQKQKESLQVARRDLVNIFGLPISTCQLNVILSLELPNDLDTWRDSIDPKDYVKQWDRMWDILKQILCDRGYILWERLGDFFLVGPGYSDDPETLPELRKSYGFGYVLPEQSTEDDECDGSIWGLCRLQYRVSYSRQTCGFEALHGSFLNIERSLPFSL